MSFLGIDLGTTGVKCIAYNEDGQSLAKAYREYMLYTPSPDIVELDPNVVWESLCLNIKELSVQEKIKKDPICALSISVSGNESLPVDNNGNALYNVIMSMDKRGIQENNWINSRIDVERLYEITGQPPSPYYPLNRLIWFKNNKPEIFKRTHKFLCWEGFILSKFGAGPVTDYSVASGTLAFDIKNKNWSDEILGRVDLNKGLLPDVFPSGAMVGTINPTVAKELGLSKDVKLVTGGWDQACAALGAGITRPGMAAVGTGTMEVMQVCFAKPSADKRMLKFGYPFCNHAVSNLYICLSINFCGGVLLKWYRDNFAQKEKEIAERDCKDVYEIIIESTKKSKYPVLFLPYFEGAQTPRNNPDVSGAMLGLSLRTQKEDIVKGMLEGLNFDLRLNIEKIEEAGTAINSLYATGGGAKSDLWLEMKANITGKTILQLDSNEAGCMSTAVLAGCAVNKFDSVEKTIENWVKVKKEFRPDVEKHKEYKDKYLQFLDVYNSLQEYKII